MGGEGLISTLSNSHFPQTYGFTYLDNNPHICPMAYRITINLEEKTKQKTNEQTQNTELLPCGH